MELLTQQVLSAHCRTSLEETVQVGTSQKPVSTELHDGGSPEWTTSTEAAADVSDAALGITEDLRPAALMRKVITCHAEQPEAPFFGSACN